MAALGKTLEEARGILRERMRRGIEELRRLLGSKDGGKRGVRLRAVAKRRTGFQVSFTVDSNLQTE